MAKMTQTQRRARAQAWQAFLQAMTPEQHQQWAGKIGQLSQAYHNPNVPDDEKLDAILLVHGASRERLNRTGIG